MKDLSLKNPEICEKLIILRIEIDSRWAAMSMGIDMRIGVAGGCRLFSKSTKH